MRFLVDAQLPPALCRWIKARGHQARYVGLELPGETPDRMVVAYAIEHHCVLVTKDEDFVSRYPPVDYLLVWLRVGNASTRVLVEWLDLRWTAIVEALDRGERLIEVR